MTDAEAKYLFSQGATPEEVAALEKQQETPAAPASLPQPIATSTPQGAASSQTAGTTDQPQEAGSTFFSPNEVASRAGEGFNNSLPLVPTLERVAQGKAAYTPDAEGAANLSGDIGGLAAGLATGGVIPLLKFAGAGAALNAAGIPQGAKRIGDAIENANEKLPSAQLPSKVMGINGLGDVMDFLQRIPATLTSSAVEAAPYALAGHAVGGTVEAPKETAPLQTVSVPEPALTDAQQQAKALQDKGYPVTAAHLTPGDTSLKAAMMNPNVAGEAKAYMDKLHAASAADVGSALDVGGRTTQQLGEQLADTYGKALAQRNTSYKNMLNMAENPAGPVNTGIGQFTHAGQTFAQGVEKDLAAKGLNLNAPTAGGEGMTVKAKALMGGGLTHYDMPEGGSLNPDAVTAAIKFADLASQKAATPVALDSLAKNFAKSEKLFQPGQGGASGASFLRDIQGQATDLSGKILQQRDAQLGPAGGAPTYPEWVKQRANWAKSADLVDEIGGKLSTPKTRLSGEDMYSSEKVSPEQFFQKNLANAGASKISAFKDMLATNGQDPAIVEDMAKDHLMDIGSKAANPSAAIETAWRKMSPEYKAAMFKPETVVGIEDALARGRQARAPLEVLGTKSVGDSATAARLAVQKQALHAGLGQIPVLGKVLNAVGEVNATNAARDLITKPAEIKPTVPVQPTLGPIDRLAALKNRVAALGNTPIPSTGQIPGIPAIIQQAMRARAARP